MLLTQLVGFAIGLALLAWCIRIAIRGGGAPGESCDDGRAAGPMLVCGLLGRTLVSLAATGTTSWIVIRPVQHLKWLAMQLLNLVTSVLNYAPVRAGLIARIAYNMRVHRLSLVALVGSFAAIGFTL